VTIDRVPSPQVRPAAARQPARTPPARLPYANLISLQQAAGNRAVGRALRTSRPRTVQRRRVPEAGQVDPLVTAGAADRDAHGRGLSRANSRALSALDPQQQATVRADAHDAALEDVFGAADIAQAKGNYGKAMIRMNTLPPCRSPTSC
jgi:hypothetical protein